MALGNYITRTAAVVGIAAMAYSPNADAGSFVGSVGSFFRGLGNLAYMPVDVYKSTKKEGNPVKGIRRSLVDSTESGLYFFMGGGGWGEPSVKEQGLGNDYIDEHPIFEHAIEARPGGLVTQPIKNYRERKREDKGKKKKDGKVRKAWRKTEGPRKSFRTLRTFN